MYHNPIIRGFAPDPSICHADGFYYLVNSTFEYFPGLPVWKSPDLVNWSYCTSVLTRTSQLPLSESLNNQGLYAPTIRFNGKRFYVVNTNKFTHENFVVHADRIEGPWSEPSFIYKTGIDPSLLFLPDGSCFYVSNGRDDAGKQGIFGQFINPDTGKLQGEMQLLTYGCGGHSVEGPHIYLINGWYYLLVAEGGTGSSHHVCMLRSKDIFGPYEQNPRNPILCHLDRKGHEIQCTGHADLIQSPEGDWYAVFLATRLAKKHYGSPLGRESFLAPVTWVDEWPVIGNNGSVELQMEGPKAEQKDRSDLSFSFDQELSTYPFLKVRVPNDECYRLDGRRRQLTLVGGCSLETHLGHPTLLAVRQPEFESVFKTILNTATLTGKAGIAVFHNSNYHYRLEIQKEQALDSSLLRVNLYRHVHDIGVVTESVTIPMKDTLELEIKSTREAYFFFVGGQLIAQASTLGMAIGATFDGSFTGTLFALWAEAGSATFLDGFTLTAKEDDWANPILNSQSNI